MKILKCNFYLLCCLLCACDTTIDRNDEVRQTVKSWIGKDVNVAFDALGDPNETRSGHGKKLYSWVIGVEENMRIIGGRVIPHEGTTDASDPSHFNRLVTCTIKVMENSQNHIILGTETRGQILVCAQFAERIRTAKAALSKDDK
jgi:hypothetical protein